MMYVQIILNAHCHRMTLSKCMCRVRVWIENKGKEESNKSTLYINAERWLWRWRLVASVATAVNRVNDMWITIKTLNAWAIVCMCVNLRYETNTFKVNKKGNASILLLSLSLFLSALFDLILPRVLNHNIVCIYEFILHFIQNTTNGLILRDITLP